MTSQSGCLQESKVEDLGIEATRNATKDVVGRGGGGRQVMVISSQ